jgi:HEPN domain-containing protein
MQPDPIRVEETLAWMKKSRKDLWRAESVLTLDPPDTEDCLFHCQQAVEKSLITGLARPIVSAHARFGGTHPAVPGFGTSLG